MPVPTSPSAIAGIGAIVAVSSAKGGVGKSTVTANLAVALHRLGKRVGILDADILGPSIPGMLGIDTGRPPERDAGGKVAPPVGHGIKAVSMAMFSSDDQPMMLRGPMVGKYLNLFLSGVDWGELDILLLDMPPGTGDIQLNIAQAFPLAGAIIVTTPQAVSTKIARRGARMFETVKTAILGIVENMRTFTCPSCGSTHDLFGHGGGERLAGELGVPFLGALPLDPAVIEAGDEGRPVTLADDGATSEAYRALAVQLIESVGGGREGLGPFRWRWAEDIGAPPWNEALASQGGAADQPAGMRKKDAHLLTILWQDGRMQDIDVRDLRLSCGCALCREEMSGKPLISPASVPLDIVPVEIRSVGNYALALSWSDGHSSGIHPFAAIRTIAAPRPRPVMAPPSASDGTPRSDAEVTAAVQHVLDMRFNPSIASHRGEVWLRGYADGVLRVEMRGGCQGCGASQLTLRRGLAAMLQAEVPEVREIVDITDHEAGTRPFYRATS